MCKKIYGFYFIAAINSFKELVTEQIYRLTNSELYKKTDKLFIRVFYENEKDKIFLLNFLSNLEKVEISFTDKNEYEFGILNIIKKISTIENFYCYYFHTKGVSITEDNFLKYKIKKFNVLKRNVESWRKIMEFFLFDKFEDNLKRLDENFDCCGVNLKPTKKTKSYHYPGNFWWSTSYYIQKLPPIDSLDLNYRWNAEFWIGLGLGKMYSYCDDIKIGYKHNTLPEEYII